jgi:simple sugar transport system substrate-binding protein
VSKPSFTLRLLALAAVAIVPLGALTACDNSSDAANASPAALKDGLGGRAKNRNVEFITYYDPSQDAFWNQIKQVPMTRPSSRTSP